MISKNKKIFIIQIIFSIISISSLIIAGTLIASLIIPKNSEQIRLEYIIESDIFDNSDNLIISDIKPNLQGYSFVGWRLDNASTIYTEDMILESGKSDNVKLYAIYKSTINLDLQGGFGSTSIVAIKDDIMPNIEMPIKTGYTFAGYFTSLNGQGTQYYDENGKGLHIDDLPNGTTLYANWIEEK